ncbi:MAG: hypothetical protein NTV63_02300, partial [Candidatus Woesearchaeota archaeon]|nr:hypothetical protein [Candidatus Woesearchaeota archaeon]
EVMAAGAMGIEIMLSGKIPSSRAKSWRVYDGYLKKAGDISIENVKRAMNKAELKTGTVGIKVSIMPPDVKIPDNMKLIEEIDEKTITETKEGKNVEEKKEIKVTEGSEDNKSEKKQKKAPRKKEEKKE